MKVVSKILGGVLIANALVCLALVFSRGVYWHLSIVPVLDIGMPLCVLVAGVLQLVKPKTALFVIIGVFLLDSTVFLYPILPIWLLYDFFPQGRRGPLVMPTVLISNALVVVTSMLVWFFTRKRLHNQTVNATS